MTNALPSTLPHVTKIPSSYTQQTTSLTYDLTHIIVFADGLAKFQRQAVYD